MWNCSAVNKLFHIEYKMAQSSYIIYEKVRFSSKIYEIMYLMICNVKYLDPDENDTAARYEI